MKKFIAVILLSALLLSGCQKYDKSNDNYTDAKSGNDIGYADTPSYGENNVINNSDSAQKEALKDSDYAAENAVADSRKLIKTGQIHAETLEYRLAVESVKQAVTAVGGYVESSNEGANGAGHYWGQFVFRIPVGEYGAVSDKVAADSLLNITSRNSGTQDVTDSYYDTEARLKAKQVQYDRLLELQKTSADLNTIIQLENEISQVTYEIEQLTGTLRKYDALTSYSTLSVNLTEVVKVTEVVKEPDSFGEELSQAAENAVSDLGAFFRGLLWFVVRNVFWLIVVAAIVAGVVWRRRKRKRTAKQSVAGDGGDNTGAPPPPPTPPTIAV